MSKTMCKSDALEKNGDKVKYTCKKCGARARKEKHLCKPKQI